MQHIVGNCGVDVLEHKPLKSAVAFAQCDETMKTVPFVCEELRYCIAVSFGD